MVHLTTENGLSHNSIRAITEDKFKNIWVTTDHGITNIVVDSSPARQKKTLPICVIPILKKTALAI